MPSSMKIERKGWDVVVKRASSIHGVVVKIGIQGSEATEAHPGGTLTNAQIGAIHEFNGPQDKPPGRPFIRPVFDNAPDKWRQKLAEVLKKGIAEGANIRGEMRRIGEEYRREIIERIKEHIAPELALSTLMARNAKKGGRGKVSGYQARAEKEARTGRPAVDDTPLIDTGTLIGAISVKVVKE